MDVVSITEWSAVAPFVFELIRIIVSAVPLLVAFWLGQLSSSSTRKSEVAKTRFEKFYLPYMQTYCKGMMWEVRFSELNPGTRAVFLALLMENYHYASNDLQSKIPDFYTTWFELDRYLNGDVRYISSAPRMDALFYDLTCTAFSEYISLCKRLKLPQPSMPPLPNEVYLKESRESETV
ncbi:MAG: hypothetical protein LBK57_03610 [Clostridiales Family XIII bacterium]|jgi:hypothetical protein|nr:hypothetical protein [Clostridiales Family XIII bacterium]